MDQLNLALAAVGIVVIVLGLLSQPLNRSVFSLPLMAFLFGVSIGPVGLGLLDVDQWGDPVRIMEEGARLTLGISLMGIALRIPRAYIFTHWRTFVVLLGLGMPLMFLVSSLLVYWLLGVPLLLAMLVGAAICPTDPVVSSSMVTGSLAKASLPGRFRHTLSAESGANDGLAYLLVLLPMLLLSAKDTSTAWSEWLTHALLWEVGGAIIFGVLTGWLFGQALQWAERNKTIDHASFLAATLALTVLVLGVGKLIGTDSLLAVFAAGIAFDQVVGGSERAEEGSVQESVNLFFTLPIFVLFGLMIPVAQWFELGWPGVALAVLVLLLRRLPVLLLLRPLMPRWREMRMALTAGYFGPIGISALFYAMMIDSRAGHDIAWTVGSLVVCASLFAHGMGAAPGAKLYARLYPGDNDS
ncbi:cation:proton antiporter [Hydrocarboniclastica marina]|uniref:Sodium:proton antiporter n=1 Tax=Hydrocarboniclastica marina TaxID=2259620 RepID=A0A4P7XIC0_9ALTE|nr:cation:proton antiporter [Hydrocarboniclastica marina]QCF26806.1 sodium:proton antiporter [Hydrocarboniclastica marina]